MKKTVPEHLSPMLAVLSEMPRDEKDYGFEFKWDGYRTLAFWNGKRFRLESRNQLDLTDRFPEIKELRKQLPASVILDGEMIATNDTGQPDFGLLQRRTELFNRYLGEAAGDRIKITYMIFDLLYEKGQPLLGLPYKERRARLEKLNLNGVKWRTSPVQYGEGSTMFEVAQKHGLEGLIAKKITSVYEPGARSPNWRKIKIIMSQEFVILGWQPGEGALDGGIRSLLLGYYSGGRLRYAGNVGTGFSNDDRFVLRKYLEKKGRTAPPVQEKVKGKNVIFLKPDLVAEIEFRGWTMDNKVRQASFKGIRTDKEPAKVIKEIKKG